MQGIHVAFSIHNLSVLCLAAFLVLTQSIYTQCWVHKQITAITFLAIICIGMECTLLILCIYAVLLQIEFVKRLHLGFRDMSKFFVCSALMHLLFFITPLVLKITDVYDDPSLLSLELWTFMNFAIAAGSFKQIRKLDRKAQTIDFLFFADESNSTIR